MHAQLDQVSYNVSEKTFNIDLIPTICRRKSTRLTAVVGGLTITLAVLFASFAKELHQVMIR